MRANATASHFDVRGRLPGLGVDALHHCLDLLHGAHFIEVCDASLDHSSDRRLPQDWVGELPVEVGDNNFGVCAWQIPRDEGAIIPVTRI